MYVGIYISMCSTTIVFKSKSQKLKKNALKSTERSTGDTYVGDSRHQILVTFKKSQTESVYELSYIKETQAWDMLVLILKTSLISIFKI